MPTHGYREHNLEGEKILLHLCSLSFSLEQIGRDKFVYPGGRREVSLNVMQSIPMYKVTRGMIETE